MFNLLPELEKKKARREYLFRFWGVFAWFFAAVFVFLFVGFLPSYLLSAEKRDAAELNHAAIKQSLEIKDGNVLEAAAKETNDKMDFLKDVGATKLPHELIREVLFEKTDRITITSFTVRTLEVKNVSYQEVYIRGKAADRASLLAFSKMIERRKEFSKVDLPVSNFKKETDIEFSIKGEGKF